MISSKYHNSVLNYQGLIESLILFFIKDCVDAKKRTHFTFASPFAYSPFIMVYGFIRISIDSLIFTRSYFVL